MKRPGDRALTRLSNIPVSAQRPGTVTELRGIIFQSDASSTIGRIFIRPIEAFDRWQAGLDPAGGAEPLAMHAGIHVLIEDGREFVAEQLVGTMFEDFKDGLNWTPVESFHNREGAGWDVTVPAKAFRGIDDAAVSEALENLNTVVGHAFVGEDCTMFVERAFGGRRLFGDSPTGQALGLGLRIGDPALPLLRRDADLDDRSSRLLRVEAVEAQADPAAEHDAPNARVWLGRAIVWGIVAGAIAILLAVTRGKHSRRR